MSETEAPPKTELEQGQKELRVDIVRHTTSNYNNYLVLENPDADPNKYVDYREQVADINEPGRALADTSAAEYADGIDPNKELVVVITSREMRAYQTAQRYLAALEKKGVEIFGGIPSHQAEGAYPVGVDQQANQQYEQPYNQVEIDKRIVPAKTPSLGYSAIWQQDMLEPSVQSVNTTFQGLAEAKLSPEDRQRFRDAREVIENEADLQSGWGGNYVKYEGQGYPFDIIPTTKDNREKMIKGLALLRRLHESKATREFEKEKDKRIRYLVFTHEENILDMVRSYFGEARVDNCDRLSLRIPDRGNEDQFITASYKGREARMSYLLLRDIAPAQPRQ